MTTSGQVTDILVSKGKRFHSEGLAFIKRNAHLCGTPEGLTQEHVDTVVTGFLNYFAMYACGMDLAISAGELGDE